MLASAVLSLAGLAAWAARGYGTVITTSGSSVGSTIASAASGDPSGLIYLAVVVLIATPVFRVGLSSVYFSHERDNRYVMITLVVLSMLIFALISGSMG